MNSSVSSGAMTSGDVSLESGSSSLFGSGSVTLRITKKTLSEFPLDIPKNICVLLVLVHAKVKCFMNQRTSRNRPDL